MNKRLMLPIVLSVISMILIINGGIINLSQDLEPELALNEISFNVQELQSSDNNEDVGEELVNTVIYHYKKERINDDDSEDDEPEETQESNLPETNADNNKQITTNPNNQPEENSARISRSVNFEEGDFVYYVDSIIEMNEGGTDILNVIKLPVDEGIRKSILEFLIGDYPERLANWESEPFPFSVINATIGMGTAESLLPKYLEMQEELESITGENLEIEFSIGKPNEFKSWFMGKLLIYEDGEFKKYIISEEVKNEIWEEYREEYRADNRIANSEIPPTIFDPDGEICQGPYIILDNYIRCGFGFFAPPGDSDIVTDQLEENLLILNS